MQGEEDTQQKLPTPRKFPVPPKVFIMMHKGPMSGRRCNSKLASGNIERTAAQLKSKYKLIRNDKNNPILAARRGRLIRVVTLC